MAINSKIEWTESTWNPVTGCSKISAGCQHCYAERMAKRLRAMGSRIYKNGFEVCIHPEMLEIPLRWRKPRMIFVCSMGGLFHGNVPVWFIANVFNVMNKAKHHVFQILTKRPVRVISLAEQLNWTKNIWMGVTIENQQYIYRGKRLKKYVPVKIKFISFEPLLGPVEMDLEGIDWVIVGGETGPGARPMKKEWVVKLRDDCLAAGIPFFFKHWGGVRKKVGDRLLEGREWNEMPKE